MTPTELKGFYVMAASRTRCTPNKTEEHEWKRAFEYADARDLEAGLLAFLEEAGRSSRGVWMPKVDELRPKVEDARRRRESRSTIQRNLAAWKCPVCHLSATAYIAPGETTFRKCRRCTAELNLVHWEEAA